MESILPYHPILSRGTLLAKTIRRVAPGAFPAQHQMNVCARAAVDLAMQLFIGGTVKFL
jgi:hypothetical protein